MNAQVLTLEQHMRQVLCTKVLPKSRFVANYLVNQAACDSVVKYIGIDANTTVIELYAGPGALSRTILNAGPKKLLSIEKSRAFTDDYVVPLQKEAGENRYSYRTGESFLWYKQLSKDDLLGTVPQQSDWSQLRKDIKFVGIFPSTTAHYFLPTYFKNCSFRLGLFAWGRIQLHILVPLITAQQLLVDCTSVQKNNLMTLLCHTYFDVQGGFTVPKECILNKSPYDYQILTLTPLPIPKNYGADPENYEYILRQFSITRKMTLDKMLAAIGAGAKILLKDVDIDPMKRGIDLTLDECAAIGRAFDKWPHKPAINDLQLNRRDI